VTADAVRLVSRVEERHPTPDGKDSVFRTLATSRFKLMMFTCGLVGG
jgi:hypothetical protein